MTSISVGTGRRSAQVAPSRHPHHHHHHHHPAGQQATTSNRRCHVHALPPSSIATAQLPNNKQPATLAVKPNTQPHTQPHAQKQSYPQKHLQETVESKAPILTNVDVAPPTSATPQTTSPLAPPAPPAPPRVTPAIPATSSTPSRNNEPQKPQQTPVVIPVVQANEQMSDMLARRRLCKYIFIYYHYYHYFLSDTDNLYVIHKTRLLTAMSSTKQL